MKNLFVVFLLLFANVTKAEHYYFSSQSGDDSRTASQATNPSTPWKTLSKLNTFFPNLKPGDAVLFKRGEIYYGRLVIGQSGLSGQPITITAYGVGAKPVITGFITVGNWQNLGGNIWESKSAVSALSGCNIVVVNGRNTARGRYPNSGYLTYQGHNGDKSITSNALSNGSNWTGAEVVIRKNHYVIDRANITSQAGNIINHGPTSQYAAQNGFGFFIQNDSRTLDTLNEWYYNPSSKKIRIYSNGTPKNVQVGTLDTLVYMLQKNYLTFDGIEFSGSNTYSVYAYWTNHIVFQNCSFNYAGMNAISAYLSSYFEVIKSSLNNTNNNAMEITSWNYTPVPTDHVLLSEDTIKNTAVLPGMGKMIDDQNQRCGIFLVGSNNTIEKCVIDSTGYIPVWWAGNSFLVNNNFISNYCFVKDDGGGIWTWNNAVPFVVFTNQRVTNNVVLNGIGASQGSVIDIFTGASGIYCDCNSANIAILGNTVANCNRNGILIHDSHEISVTGNTVYNNNFQITLFSDNTFTDNPSKVSLIRNINVSGNIFLSKTPQQITLAVVHYQNDVKLFGVMNSNYYARPIADASTIEVVSSSPAWVETLNSLSAWQAYAGFDNSSKKSPIIITDPTAIRFEYNATGKTKTVSLDKAYIDVTDKTYTGKISLSPYSSIILMSLDPGNNRVKQNPPKQPGGTPVVY